MKKLLVFILTLSMFAACNNDKKEKTSRDRTEREKDDYSKDDKNKGDDEEDAGKDEEKTSSNSSSGWPSTEKNAFLTSCVKNAQQGGAMSESKATSYCECMLDYVIEKYPTPADAIGINTQGEEFMKKATSCLGLDQ